MSQFGVKQKLDASRHFKLFPQTYAGAAPTARCADGLLHERSCGAWPHLRYVRTSDKMGRGVGIANGRM